MSRDHVDSENTRELVVQDFAGTTYRIRAVKKGMPLRGDVTGVATGPVDFVVQSLIDTVMAAAISLRADRQSTWKLGVYRRTRVATERLVHKELLAPAMPRRSASPPWVSGSRQGIRQCSATPPPPLTWNRRFSVVRIRRQRALLRLLPVVGREGEPVPAISRGGVGAERDERIRANRRTVKSQISVGRPQVRPRRRALRQPDLARVPCTRLSRKAAVALVLPEA